MDFNVSGGTGAFVVVMALWGIGVTIYWMVVAWRAMCAHDGSHRRSNEWRIASAKKR